MKINILTLFPEMFAPLMESMLGRAVENGILEINIVNIRDYTHNKHNRVDDTPYGGGAGMLMQCQPIWDAYCGNEFGGKVLYMSPRGEKLSGSVAGELAEEKEITILCGHYEGVDQRVLDRMKVREISIGDYVLTGGELPAMVLIDTVARFIDGVLASEESALEESVYSGLLEYPHYSKPREWEGEQVPDVLLSGNHGMIDLWRFEEALKLTKQRRPDMFEAYINSDRSFSKQEQKIIESYR